MPITEASVRAAVESFVEPYLQQTLAQAQVLRAVELAHEKLLVRIELGFPTLGYTHSLQSALQAHLRAQGIHAPLTLELSTAILPHAVQRNLKPLAGVKNIVAVASGKGGVGKSTVAVNLALAWAGAGAQVGILDADIYGPSQPLMLGIAGTHPSSADGKRMQPLYAHGLAAMSIGFLVDPAQAVIWRGPMVTQALTQLLTDTEWGELDYLVVDMPPGTGDIQLTLAQRVPVAGAIIVTTPQEIALADARKGLTMFEKVSVPVLGIVENMSVHICSHCGHVEHVFGAGGGARLASEFGVALLGELPLDARIREQADGGWPTVIAEPHSPIALAYIDAARRAAAVLSRRARDRSALFPKIVIEDT